MILPCGLSVMCFTIDNHRSTDCMLSRGNLSLHVLVGNHSSPAQSICHPTRTARFGLPKQTREVTMFTCDLYGLGSCQFVITVYLVDQFQHHQGPSRAHTELHQSSSMVLILHNLAWGNMLAATTGVWPCWEVLHHNIVAWMIAGDDALPIRCTETVFRCFSIALEKSLETQHMPFGLQFHLSILPLQILASFTFIFTGSEAEDTAQWKFVDNTFKDGRSLDGIGSGPWTAEVNWIWSEVTNDRKCEYIMICPWYIYVCKYINTYIHVYIYTYIHIQKKNLGPYSSVDNIAPQLGSNSSYHCHLQWDAWWSQCILSQRWRCLSLDKSDLALMIGNDLTYDWFWLDLVAVLTWPEDKAQSHVQLAVSRDVQGATCSAFVCLVPMWICCWWSCNLFGKQESPHWDCKGSCCPQQHGGLQWCNGMWVGPVRSWGELNFAARMKRKMMPTYVFHFEIELTPHSQCFREMYKGTMFLLI